MSDLKMKCAQAALKYVVPGELVGIGTGSTVNCFIECLANEKPDVQGYVASSIATEALLKKHGLPVVNAGGTAVPVYIDGADEFNPHFELVKGGGGALTREKILAAIASQFVCIVDETKAVPLLGEHPVAIEVIEMARSYVSRKLVAMGANPIYRDGFKTDNGNIIIDAWQLNLDNPMQMESELNQIEGIVASGIFAKRPADIILVGKSSGVETLKR